MSKIGIYPGTFDPLTNGHMDIIRRSRCLFDKLIIAVAPSRKKQPFFTLEERMDFIKESTKNIPCVAIKVLEGLLATFVCEHRGTAVVRGLRAVSDFEYELQMALVNRRLNPNLETVFMMPSEEYTFLTATAVREIAFFGGNIEEFVPQSVADAFNKKLKKL
jgi:pantetheine-phosphate adenylyltransferase